MPTEHTPLVDVGTHGALAPEFASLQRGPFTTVVAVIVVLLSIFFATSADYDDSKYQPSQYVAFRDITVMLLLGFGYLMTFLGRYGLGSVGFTMLLTAVAIPLNAAVEHYVRVLSGRADEDESASLLRIGLDTIIDGEFFAATVLISFGAIIGRASPLQLIVMVLGESVFYAINKVVFVLGSLQTEDVGGSMTIHMFGAYFGLACSKMLGPEKSETASKADATQISDILSLVGTTLLWVYWPSFVGATETGIPKNEHLCIVQTIIALVGSTLATFYMSPRLCHGKLDPVHVANSTLAGGVAVGASARLSLTPGGALLLGVLAGAISVRGYVTVSPMLQNVFNIYDTCGVGNLHGLPSLLGGLASAVFVVLDATNKNLPEDAADASGVQVVRQLAGVGVTLVVSIASGTFTGAIMNMAKATSDGKTPDEYDDGVFWEGNYFE